MMPNNVDPVLFVGPPESNHSTFLYQFAIYWAQQGRKVLHISKTRYSNIPPNIHGFCRPGAEELGLIRFVYLPSQEDLLKFLFSIHAHASVPSVLIIEGLEQYISQENDSNVKQMMNAMVAASLLNAASVCGKITKENAVLIVSIKSKDRNSANMSMLSTIFFTDIIWMYEMADKKDTEFQIIRKEAYPGQGSKTSYYFTSLNNGELKLKKIVQALRDPE